MLDQQTYQDLTYFASIILLPFIPAFVLYKALPSRTHASGPFKGLRIDLSGAFAGYFLLLLLLTPIAVAWHKRVNTYGWFDVAGQMTPKDNVPPNGGYAVAGFALMPESLHLNPQTGQFDMRIPVPQDSEGNYEFPVLLIDFPDFNPVTLHPGSPRTTDIVAPEIKGHVITYKAIPIERRTP